jgi:hypothetical protein
MAGQAIDIPNFDFSGFYYPQLYEALLAFKRINVPELTDESEKEASIQLLRAFALTGHLNNVLLDLIANENTLPTAQLPETIRNMLRLIAYELKPALPASVDLLYKLSKVFSSGFSLIPVAARAATASTSGDVAIIFFEALTGLTIGRTDQLGAVFKYTSQSDSWTDNTAAANAGTNWDATLHEGLAGQTEDALYFGHADVMFSVLNLAFVSGITTVTLGVWEYFDGSNVTTRPDAVSVAGNSLTLTLNGFLGSQSRAGLLVRVTLNKTGAFRDIISDYDGTNNIIVTDDLMGQSVPSVLASDYSVGSNWQELNGVLDGTSNLAQSGEVTFTLPQTQDQNWSKATVNGFTGFLIRFRAIHTLAGFGSVLARARIDTGAQFALLNATQGQSVKSETLGSSNGDPNQQFDCQQPGFILGSQTLRVDDAIWTPVDNFLNSSGQDKVYRLILAENDTATVLFGDGVNSKIPDIGQSNITIDYRFGASDNGNVGANTVTVDKQGLSFVQSITNPRAASGWVASQASDSASLEQAKVIGPASLRVKEVALSAEDLVDLTLSFTDSSGVQPFSRAKSIEEGFGPKTVEVVTVAHGGSIPSSAQLSELALFYNGDSTATPPLKKHFIANQQGVPTSFTPRPIDVDAVVYVPADVTEEQIKNALAAVLQPEARREDGVTFTWNFGGLVPFTRISHEIFRVDARISRVVLNTPLVDIQLGGRELPVPGTFTIKIVST